MRQGGIVGLLAGLAALSWLSAGCPAQSDDWVKLRVATFNVADVRTADLLHGESPRLRRVAEVLQRIRPNIVLLNEIAYDLPGGPDAPTDAEPGQNAARFAARYLSVPQAPGLRPLRYRAYMAPTNTGMASGFDLDNDGSVVTTYLTPPPAAPTDAGRAYGNDCWGFGAFPGQYGMALLVDERLAFDPARVRTFRLLPWDYMPGALLPRHPETDEPWFDDAELEVFRLSSKSHWDAPVTLPNGRELRLLCSHPTPPAFDGPEMRNRRRNADEIRFWADYLSNEPYIVDDDNRPGGIERGAAFVILGDLNADPDEGSSFKDPIRTHLLANRLIGPQDAPLATIDVEGLDADDTASFGLRVDYVLPWRGILIDASGVWRQAPTGTPGDGFPSDHYPVWADIRVPPPRAAGG